MPKTSQAVRVARARSVIRGVEKRFSPRTTYNVNGTPFTGAEIAAVFRRYMDAVEALSAARAAYGAAVAAERFAARNAAELTAGLKVAVRSVLGLTPETFADFGWEIPKTTGPKTLRGKVEGAMKARGTRKARKTMGPRQRQKIRAGR
jgi:hypothetical protein